MTSSSAHSTRDGCQGSSSAVVPAAADNASSTRRAGEGKGDVRGDPVARDSTEHRRQPLGEPPLDTASRYRDDFAGERIGRRDGQKLGECIGQCVGALGTMAVSARAGPPRGRSIRRLRLITPSRQPPTTCVFPNVRAALSSKQGRRSEHRDEMAARHRHHIAGLQPFPRTPHREVVDVHSAFHEERRCLTPGGGQATFLEKAEQRVGHECLHAFDGRGAMHQHDHRPVMIR